MSTDIPSRMRELYGGEAGAVWARIERERPSTYWEENAVLGRRDTYEALSARLRPLAGRRILDAGCGRGLLARRLAGEGAVVTAVDVLVHAVLEARASPGGHGPRFAVASFSDLVAPDQVYDDLIVQEVLEDYGPPERLEAIRGLARSRARTIHVIFRRPGRWGGLINPLLPSALVPALDPVELLRSIHLHTPYRLAFQESVRRRSYNVQWVGLTLPVE